MLIRTKIGLPIPKLQSVFFLALFFSTTSPPDSGLIYTDVTTCWYSHNYTSVRQELRLIPHRSNEVGPSIWRGSHSFLLRYNLMYFKISFTYSDDILLALILASPLARSTLLL